MTVSRPRHYDGEVVDLAELAKVAGTLLVGFSFERCILRGPVVVTMQGKAHVTNSRLPHPSTFMQVTDGHPLMGVVVLMDCVIDGCDFQEVGLVGTETILDAFRVGFMEVT